MPSSFLLKFNGVTFLRDGEGSDVSPATKVHEGPERDLTVKEGGSDS